MLIKSTMQKKFLKFSKVFTNIACTPLILISNNSELAAKYLPNDYVPSIKELYGSVKPTEISKLINEIDKIEIKPSMIQPVKEIKSIGKFKVKISLHSEVDAEITINVVSAETIQ